MQLIILIRSKLDFHIFIVWAEQDEMDYFKVRQEREGSRIDHHGRGVIVKRGTDA